MSAPASSAITGRWCLLLYGFIVPHARAAPALSPDIEAATARGTTFFAASSIISTASEDWLTDHCRDYAKQYNGCPGTPFMMRDDCFETAKLGYCYERLPQKCDDVLPEQERADKSNRYYYLPRNTPICD